MPKDEQRKGELFIFSSALLWGLFPVITILSYNKVSPFVSLAVSTLFATLIFAGMMTFRKKWHELKSKGGVKNAVLTSLFIGIGYYALYYLALTHTSAGNASIIALTEVFFSFLLFHVFKKEHIPRFHAYGAVLMVLGAIIVLYPNFHSFQSGDLLILLAALIAPFGNMYQQRARHQVSADTIMFVRSLVTFIFMLVLIFLIKAPFSFADVNKSLVVLLINGVLIFAASKIFWIEGIHRISVTKAVALESISPLLTLLFALIFLRNIPTVWQLTSFAPMFFGVLLLSSKKK